MKIFLILLLNWHLCVATKELATANNQFAGNLYTEVTKDKPGNFLVSPFSVEAVLAFTQSGAKGATAEEIRNALHLPNDKEKVESVFKSLLPNIKGNELYSLSTANKLYLKENFVAKDGFKKSASSVYGAEVESVNFEKPDAANTINSWVEKQTNDKIKNLISSNDVNGNTRVVLVNALYFQANWSVPFLLKHTDKKDFHKTPTETVQVDTLRHPGKDFKYYDNSELKAEFLELPFQGDEASLVIVLPKDKDGLQSFEQRMDQALDLGHPMVTTCVDVTLPKFKIESSIDLKIILQNLGVKSAFDKELADLSDIAGQKGDLVVDKVKQKTFIDVNENGVEAAAATFVGTIGFQLDACRAQTKFIADHPFLFYIKHKDVIIFAGRVTSPEV